LYLPCHAELARRKPDVWSDYVVGKELGSWFLSCCQLASFHPMAVACVWHLGQEADYLQPLVFSGEELCFVEDENFVLVVAIWFWIQGLSM
jgi:hypothetical protein